MSDFISKKELYNKICSSPDGTWIPDFDCDNFPVTIAMKDIKATILKFPTVDLDDAAPVIHGEWQDTEGYDNFKTPIYECSVCHKQVADNYIKCHKYCLHCGAKMKVEGTV